tara:strand:+ start:1260 stop:1667 length:408 start_codon:yes stop_codon:yes gene_type:complete
MIMTRHTLIPPVLLALVSFPIFGMDFNDLAYREGLYYDKSTDSPFTGKVRGLSEGLIREGKQEGPWIEFHRKRKLYLKGNYENGKRNGSWAAYWSSGQLVHQAIFKNGVREGNWNDYINGGNVAKMYAATSKGRR